MLGSVPTRRLSSAVRLLGVLTLVLGVAYPAVVAAAGALVFPGRAGGSLLRLHGQVVGSSLIGQSFRGPSGQPLAQWFQPRPSASGYNALASGATNLGPDSRRLLAEIQRRRAALAAFNSTPGHPVSPAQVPPDALTASGSGLDPDISPAYAYLQVYRVARARGLPAALVRRLVAAHVRGRDLGVLGEPRVDVLTLNLALAALGAPRR